MAKTDPRPKGVVTYHWKNNGYGGLLSVPSEIAQLIPNGSKFTCSLTEDGILFKPFDPLGPTPPIPVPGWLQPKSP